MTTQIQLQPRLLRLKDAPAYLAMDRHRFNTEVRPHLIEIPIGTQGIAFDRLDLDAWVEHHKQRSGRPAVTTLRGNKLWDAKERQGSTNVMVSGKSTKKSSDVAFAKALARVNSKKPSAISQRKQKK